MLTPAQVFLMGKKVTPEYAKYNKYTYMASKYNYPHYRILSIGDLLKKKVVKDKDIPAYFMDFVGEQGEVLVVANIVNNKIPFIQARSLKTKQFNVLGSQTRVPYGLGFLSKDFKYGDPIFLVEGIADCDTLRGLYPNVLGTLTAGLTVVQFEIVTRLTNKIVLAYDNDQAGRSAYKRDSKKLKEAGIANRCFIQYAHYKDVGDLSEELYQGNTMQFETAYQYYQTQARNNVLSLQGGL